jgi:hypothetical protein
MAMRTLPGLFLFLCLSTIHLTPAWAFEIPKGLSSTDRQEVVRTLGLNSASKILSNPYPLGGYSGFELAVDLEFINVRDVQRLGCAVGSAGCPNTKLGTESEWRYSRFSIGKGLYDDVDLFINFMLPVGGVRASDYGGMLRWSFYQARFLPINISAVLHANQLNFADSFINRNFGADLMVGVNVDNFALYFGGGQVQAYGTFTGALAGTTCEEDCTTTPGDPALNENSRTISERINETHLVVGLSMHFDNLFAAAEVDRYRDAVYSLKTGLRF